MNSAKVICLTPVKNEGWILDKFLAATSLWADHIIIADQMSDDGSREIAEKYEKVILVDNKSLDFNEPERQKLLIHEARKIGGKKLLITLDADEFFSGNALESQSWKEMLTAAEGTVFSFKWPCIGADFKTFWYPGEKMTYMKFAYVDDGAEHKGSEIHSTRIPISDKAIYKKIDDFVVMHFQFVDWKRMESKHRWYQCLERIKSPNKSAIEIFRRYNHMFRVRDNLRGVIPKEWFSYYLKRNVAIKTIDITGKYYWDEEVDKFIDKYGIEYFKNIDLPHNNSMILRYLRRTRSYKYSFLERVISKIKKL